ncbi:MAG TPA: type II toxin-antitoxin system death-on-curing family toxin [Treponemataceae bacterium]|jgi:death-on-curing protein|nr:type II toxin-antitoxin system death-on-curing family toxin [Treponemataceae bacterium]
MQNIQFLSVSDILIIHEDQIRNYGGIYGTRDISLVSSAQFIPEASFGGEYVCKSIEEMAAAYAYHLCQNHPFLDGNKRTALAVSLVFLDLNGYELDISNDDIYKIMMRVAESKLSKQELTALFSKYCKKIISP